MKNNVVASYNRKICMTFKSNLTYKTNINLFNYTCIMFNQVVRCKFNAKKRFEQMFMQKSMQINHKIQRT